MESLLGHTWCNCLQCDKSIEAFSILVVGTGNRDNTLGLSLVHFSLTDDTSYLVFNELYYLLSHDGEVQDEQLVDSDEDEDEDDDDDY